MKLINSGTLTRHSVNKCVPRVTPAPAKGRSWSAAGAEGGRNSSHTHSLTKSDGRTGIQIYAHASLRPEEEGRFREGKEAAQLSSASSSLAIGESGSPARKWLFWEWGEGNPATVWKDFFWTLQSSNMSI